VNHILSDVIQESKVQGPRYVDALKCGIDGSYGVCVCLCVCGLS
jgi:hypothetical protein